MIWCESSANETRIVSMVNGRVTIIWIWLLICKAYIFLEKTQVVFLRFWYHVTTVRSIVRWICKGWYLIWYLFPLMQPLLQNQNCSVNQLWLLSLPGLMMPRNKHDRKKMYFFNLHVIRPSNRIKTKKKIVLSTEPNCISILIITISQLQF